MGYQEYGPEAWVSVTIESVDGNNKSDVKNFSRWGWTDVWGVISWPWKATIFGSHNSGSDIDEDWIRAKGKLKSWFDQGWVDTCSEKKLQR